MQTWLKSTYIALQLNPFIAVAAVLPYVIVRYVRTRSVNVCRCVYTYIFAMYLLCAFFMTMLPFPDPGTLVLPVDWGEVLDLIPVKRFIGMESERVFGELMSVVMNVVMTVPLGFFLRRLFGLNAKKTALGGLAFSLLLELIQLTGLFFIYPRPYRLVSTEDLIMNTLGALVGYAVTPWVARLLPDPDDSHGIRLEHGSEVVFLQRAVASAIDLALTLAVTVGIIAAIEPLEAFLVERDTLWRFPVFFLLFLGVVVLYTAQFEGGRTLGYRLAGLQLIKADGSLVSRRECVIRTLLIYVTVYSVPFWVLFFATICMDYDGPISVLWVFLSCMLMLLMARNVLEAMFNAVTRGASMYYDRHMKLYLTYRSSRRASLFGIRIIDTRMMRESEVDALSGELCQVLSDAGLDRRAVEKARLMTEGLMLDWLAHGLRDVFCELRLDKGIRRHSLLFSVAGENVVERPLHDSYVDMLSGLDLTLETYYAGGKNICIIHMKK